jgi:hypothetical protein
MKTPVSPDHQIITFTILGGTYRYAGSSGKVELISSKGFFYDLTDQIHASLANIVTQHIPASEQITNALAPLGFEIEDMEYLDDVDQPTEDQPEIS